MSIVDSGFNELDTNRRVFVYQNPVDGKPGPGEEIQVDVTDVHTPVE